VGTKLKRVGGDGKDLVNEPLQKPKQNVRLKQV